MVTEVNHDSIKGKVKDILEANTALFTVTAEVDKIRRIEVGFPDGKWNEDQMFPYIFITNGVPFESIISDVTIISNAVVSLVHTFNYDVVIVTNDQNARIAEDMLDDFQKLVLQTLEADVNLTGTGSADVDYSIPVSAQIYRPMVFS